MKGLLLALILSCLLLVGCMPGPNFVSVSRDGTIAFCLAERVAEEEGSGSEDEYSERIYLTNANADFLIEVEELAGCLCPIISPPGKHIVAISDDGLLLYDRKTEKSRIIYRPRKGDDGSSLIFSTWSPDGKKIAFLAGSLDDDSQNCTLNVYDLKRRELEVLARGASPRVAWLPDSKRLVYISIPSSGSENDGFLFGDLKMINVRSRKQRTLARRELILYSGIAVFPDGESILFPCVDWEDVDIGRAGMTVPIVLKKESLPRPGKKAAKQKPRQAEEEEATRAEAKSDAEKAPSAAGEEKPQERGFVLREGQPFCPLSCAVSPDGERIAYFRYTWGPRSAEDEAVEKEESEGEEAEEMEADQVEAAAEESEESDEEGTGPDGLELCVARADGTGSIAVARDLDNDFPQVLWVSDTRLICVTDESIIAVDADGENKLDLIEAVKTKFPDQFERARGEKGQEEKEEDSHSEPESK